MDHGLEKAWDDILETVKEFIEIVNDLLISLAEPMEPLADIDDILWMNKNKFRKCAACLSKIATVLLGYTYRHPKEVQMMAKACYNLPIK